MPADALTQVRLIQKSACSYHQKRDWRVAGWAVRCVKYESGKTPIEHQTLPVSSIEFHHLTAFSQQKAIDR